MERTVEIHCAFRVSNPGAPAGVDLRRDQERTRMAKMTEKVTS